jgi:hypothetical protein
MLRSASGIAIIECCQPVGARRWKGPGRQSGQTGAASQRIDWIRHFPGQCASPPSLNGGPPPYRPSWINASARAAGEPAANSANSAAIKGSPCCSSAKQLQPEPPRGKHADRRPRGGERLPWRVARNNGGAVSASNRGSHRAAARLAISNRGRFPGPRPAPHLTLRTARLMLSA